VKIILGLAAGKAKQQIAKQLGIARQTVWRWEQRYLQQGSEKGLQDAPRSGRPRLIAPEKIRQIVHKTIQEPPPKATVDSPTGSAQVSGVGGGDPTATGELRPATRALIEILHHKPSAYGINRSNWTHGSLADAFAKLYGQRPSKSTVSRLLRQAGLSWKKSQKVLTSPDPNYREKVELLLSTLHSLKADEDLFFIDELGPLPVRRYGGRCYTPKGQTPTHPQNQRSKGSITLYGALSTTTNQVIWFYGNTKDSAGIIDLAEIVFNQCHNKSRIFLAWDAASWHRSNEFVTWADDFNKVNKANRSGPIIDVVPLPASAQFLDVIEAVFSSMKRAVIHSSDYASEEEMKTAISTHFRERNEFFKHHPRRAGKKIWEIDFFKDYNNIKSGNYREW
jgi:transposase